MATDTFDVHAQLNQHKKMMDAYQRQSIQAKQQQARMNEDARNAQLARWQEAVGKIAEAEALLASLIAQEVGYTRSLSINEASGLMHMNWAGRLDMLIGELGRYRDTLGRRVAEGLMPRLIGTTNDDAANAPV